MCLLALSLWLIVPYKELKLSLLDRHLAERFRLHPGLLLFVSLTLICLTAVVSFRIAGSVLIVAMMIAPPAAAWFLSRHFSHFLILAVLIAVVSSVAGFYASREMSVAPTGPIAATSGCAFLLALLFAPRVGLLTTAIQRRRQMSDLRTCLILSRVRRCEGPFALDSVEDPEERRTLERSMLRFDQAGLLSRTSDGRFEITEPGHVTISQLEAQFQL